MKEKDKTEISAQCKKILRINAKRFEFNMKTNNTLQMFKEVKSHTETNKRGLE